MRITKNQLLLLGAVLVVGGVLYFSGYKTPEADVKAPETKETAVFDFDTYLGSAKGSLGEESKKAVAAIDDTKGDADTYKKLIVLWDSTSHPLVAAHYMEKLAMLEPHEKNWFAAGSKYYMVAATSNDSLIARESATRAKFALEKVIAINGNNLDAKNALAACYIEVDQDVMKGVGMLKEVVEKDSNNVQAIYTLGMLSIRSGQFDKAQQRFEKLVAMQPFNPEYYYYLGEIYAKTGNVQHAIKTYEKCRTLLKDEDARKEVDNIINKLKNI